MGRRVARYGARTSGLLAGLALIGSGVGVLYVGAAETAGASGPQTVCGSPTTLPITSSSTFTPTALTVPQYNGTDLVGVQLSLQITHTFGPDIVEFNGSATYTAAASGDNVLVEMSGPGLPALGPYVNTAPTSNAGFTGTSVSGPFSAGDPTPSLPAGLVAAADSDAISVETSAGGIGPSWNGLGFGAPQIVAAPWPNGPTTVVTANDSSTLNSGEQTETVSDLSDYEGTGSVSMSAVYFNAGLHSLGSGSNTGFGSQDSMSVEACATYTVLGAATPEVPSVLLLPASAAFVAGGMVLLKRRRSHRQAPTT